MTGFTKLRFGSLLVVFAMVVPAVAVAVSPFVDVSPGAFYEASVNWAFSNGITTGRNATHFDPDAGVTRGESVTFLKRYDDNVVGQTLGQLSCTTSEVGHYDGAGWICGTITPTFTPRTDKTTAVDFGGAEHTSVAIGVDNFPIISYSDLLDSALRVFHCTDEACTAGAATTIGSAGGFGRQQTSITIGADNLAIISHYQSLFGDLNVFHCTNVACTSGTATALDTVGDVGWYSSIAIGADNLPIISYQDGTNGNLKVFHCTDAACTSGTATAIDTGGVVGLYTSITIGADNLPIISYNDQTNNDLKVFHCTDTACTSGTATAIDTGGVVGWYTSITIGADNLPIISYYDQSNMDLKVFHCADTACASGTATAIDTADAVGLYTSITLGTDDRPVISYQDFTNSALKVIHCNDEACTSGNASSIDTVRDVGKYTSIAIGADDLPIVSYYDETNADLKVAHVYMFLTGIGFG